jgi:8-oxo-dGTP pyrophosphatase MutT (NUDIX family)
VNEELLRRALARPSPYPARVWEEARASSPAAVCVPIALDPTPTAYAVLRSSELRDHAGEVGFPGGKPEAIDRDLQQTALRELGEEVGVQGVILGALTTVPVITGRYMIHPFVTLLGDERPTVRSPEIAAVLPIPLLSYLHGDVAIHAVETNWKGDRFLAPHFTLGDSILYGASAYILYELLLRVAAELAIELPAPTLVAEYPWGDRYGHGRGHSSRR